jgi:peptidoglycan/LPS O-acetylase OafA/YrhL
LTIAAYESQVCDYINRHKLICFVIIIAALIAPIITSNLGTLILGYNIAPIAILMFAYTNKMAAPKFLTILGGISLEIYLVHGLFVIEYAKLFSNAWCYEIMVCASTLISAYFLNKLSKSINN